MYFDEHPLTGLFHKANYLLPKVPISGNLIENVESTSNTKFQKMETKPYSNRISGLSLHGSYFKCLQAKGIQVNNSFRRCSNYYTWTYITRSSWIFIPIFAAKIIIRQITTDLVHRILLKTG